MNRLTYSQIEEIVEQINIEKLKEFETSLYSIYENEEVDFESEQNIDEGIIKSLIGAVGGAIIGPKVGHLVAKVLGIEKGILYNFLTSTIVSAALGLELAKSRDRESKN